MKENNFLSLVGAGDAYEIWFLYIYRWVNCVHYGFCFLVMDLAERNPRFHISSVLDTAEITTRVKAGPNPLLRGGGHSGNRNPVLVVGQIILYLWLIWMNSKYNRRPRTKLLTGSQSVESDKIKGGLAHSSERKRLNTVFPQEKSKPNQRNKEWLIES